MLGYCKETKKPIRVSDEWLAEVRPDLKRQLDLKEITEEQAYFTAGVFFPKFCIYAYIGREKAVELLHAFYDKLGG